MIASHGPRGRCVIGPSGLPDPPDPDRPERLLAAACGPDGVHILIVEPIVGGCASAIPACNRNSAGIVLGCVCNATSLRVRNDTASSDPGTAPSR